jgi:peptidyl-prolyl cis-trans isomerase C
MAAAAAVITISACNSGGDQVKIERLRDDPAVAVIIEGEPIHFSDVELEARAQGVIKDGEKLEPGGADYERILQELIDQKLLAQEAGRRGLDQPEDAQFRLAMAKERTLGLLLMEDLVASKVTPEAVERLYREQLKLLQLGQETRVRQIVVATQAEAVALKRQLDRGADFTKLAFQRSLDADTRLDGGDLGFITPESRPQAFAQAVQATEVGKVSEPFELDRSWRLVMVVERREEQPPSLEESRDKLVRFLTFDQIQTVLEGLRRDARVEQRTAAGAMAPIKLQPAPEDGPMPDLAPPPDSNATPPADAPASAPGQPAAPAPARPAPANPTPANPASAPAAPAAPGPSP